MNTPTPPMTGSARVLSGGAGCTVQDRGRYGWRHVGVPVSGCLDQPLADAANALLDNPPEAAVLELRGLPLTLQAGEAALDLAVAGAATLRRRAAPEASWQAALPWQGLRLAAQEQLHVQPAPGRCVYLALGGGVACTPVLGSRATYVRAGLGGLHGRMLQPQDSLAAARAAPGPLWRAPQPWVSAAPEAGVLRLRVLHGPQHQDFSPEAWSQFLTQTWQASAAQDRMGLRLQGQALALRAGHGVGMWSDAVAPGAVQVPADGMPIVLLADAQTVGGYPKIASVIQADLPALAQAPEGTALRFEACTPEQARAAAQAQAARWQAWAAQRQACAVPRDVDLAALYQHSLVSGMINALNPSATP
ncbi:biotin-dependent carboxyltransferase family protein [Roseateles sp. BYS180W]|uniref:Biotin-dependent carboxyltransferase family protein n=1 Tax=Roseateles rivi TaxID=3299028 RepID=A0ABW7FX16_9BURK